METLQISKENAIKAYKQANDKGKTLLSNLFGKKVFSPNITERVFTLEDVCQEAGEDIEDYTIPKDASRRDRGTILFNILQLICEVFREGVELDYSDPRQRKYYLWGEYKAGSGWSLPVVLYDLTSTAVGARLSVDTREKAEHIWECFSEYFIWYWEGK